MEEADVVIAGAGVAGLLLASELSRECRVVVLEQAPRLPVTKYWLTSAGSLAANPGLRGCVASLYDAMDFIAYDETRARVGGPYVFWNTGLLLQHLLDLAQAQGARVLFEHALLTYRLRQGRVIVSTSAGEVRARLLVDCMGYASPIVSAKRVVQFLGFFVLQGHEVVLNSDVCPVALHNPLLQSRPTYFELFPASDGTGVAAMITPTSTLHGKSTLARDLRTVLGMEPYRHLAVEKPGGRRLFGIIPVGLPRRLALDRVYFFGEAGQVNPPTSATGLTRMLYTYRETARRLLGLLGEDDLSASALSRAAVPGMTRLHRLFQTVLFERLLGFTSDDFRELVLELDRQPDELVNGLIFAETSLLAHPRALLQAVLRPRGFLGPSLVRGLLQWPVPYSWRPST